MGEQINNVGGFHAVEMLLKHGRGRIQQLFHVQGRQDQRLLKLIELARFKKISVQSMALSALNNLLPGVVHQGVVLAYEPVGYADVNLVDLCKQRKRDLLLLVLDEVQDPHNFGACLRSAAVSGVDAVIIPKNNAVGITSVVRKVSCGGAEVVPVVRVTNLVRTLRELQSAGAWVYGFAEQADDSLYQASFSGPVVMVMGSESHGLRQLTRQNCDFICAIPSVGCISSLNVSVATGVALFEVQRQRGIVK